MTVVKGAFEKAKLYIESHSKEPIWTQQKKKQGPCITISRETGAGAGCVGDELVKFFQSFCEVGDIPWTAFDKNLIEKVMEDHHLPQKLKQYFIEDKLSEFKATINELLGIHPHAWMLVSKTASTIVQLAYKGNVVIIGRAANIVTANLKNTFHVRLIGSFENRVKHVQEIHNLNRNEAIEFTKNEDNAKQDYFKKYYNKEIEDPLLYHMIINTDNISYEMTARIIGRAVIDNFPEMFVFKEENILNRLKQTNIFPLQPNSNYY